MKQCYDRNYSVNNPLEKFITDMTYLEYALIRLYLSSIMGIFNGEILTYTISDKQDITCIFDTLNQLLDVTKDCLLHADHSSVYVSYAYYQVIKKTSADNYHIELFHSTLCHLFQSLRRIKSTIHFILLNQIPNTSYFNTKLNKQLRVTLELVYL